VRPEFEAHHMALEEFSVPNSPLLMLLKLKHLRFEKLVCVKSSSFTI
jgi:hypothetical protein